ncbi:MAG: DUF1385 domain-containing protein [Dehalococcoidia bacterium]|nr:DUF1385 domain-containing protein [Dehalococcoidia bacterium]
MAAERKVGSDQPDPGTRPEPRFFYGGQAVIEGVLIRGRRFSSVVVRRPDGQIAIQVSPLSTVYTGPIRRVPLVRGVVVLAETLVLGTRALMYSANVSIGQEGKEMSRWSMAVTMAISLGFAIGIFFLLPLLVASLFQGLLGEGVGGDILFNVVEGGVRLTLFLGYVWGIGFIPDIRRVFAYHGAEHMTVKAYEANDPLETAHIRKYSTAHPRCGTAFLLVVMVIAILVFAFFGRPPIFWLVLSRLVLVPVIAGMAYEVIRFSGGHQNSALVRLIVAPSLMLQALTTRQPDDDQIEVAVLAMRTTLAADQGQALPSAGESGTKEARPETETH